MSKNKKKAKKNAASQVTQEPKTSGVVKFVPFKKLNELLPNIQPKRIAFDLTKKRLQVHFVDRNTTYNFKTDHENMYSLLEVLSSDTVVAFEDCDGSNDLGLDCQSLGLVPHILPSNLFRDAGDQTYLNDAEAIYRTDETLASEEDGATKLVPIKTEEELYLSSMFSYREDVAKQKDVFYRALLESALKCGYIEGNELSVFDFAKFTILDDPTVSQYVLEKAESIAEEKIRTSDGNVDHGRVLAEANRLAEQAFFDLSINKIADMRVPHGILFLCLYYQQYFKEVAHLEACDKELSKITQNDALSSKLP